jgi:hypothetical protein
MPRFAVVATHPYQDRAIVNLDSIAVVTTKTEPSGGKSLQLQMVDGSKVLINASFADLQHVLNATPLAAQARQNHPHEASAEEQR